MVEHADEYHMRRALVLAAGRAGDTWPNPTVGARVVKDGRVLAEGVHLRAGEAHAEIVALRAAGEAARGSTLYVTLEPCHHQGRTPPCSEAIHRAGVARVVYAVTDDNPALSGGGGDWLRAQGLELRSGVLERAAWELNHPFFESSGGSRAHLTCKLALSLDGRTARSNEPEDDPRRRRITGPVAHRLVHRLRERASVVLVGARTAAWDRPRLDVRLPGARRQPWPAVIDPGLRLSADELPGAGGPRPALILCAEDAPRDRRERLEEIGHQLLPCPRGPNGELGGEAILAALHERGRGQVLLEGGWHTALPFLREGLVDRLHLFWAPLFLGGDGPGPGGAWPGAEVDWESYLLARRGDDIEWILRRRGLPAAAGAQRNP